jgi:hypothetical protein
MLYLRIMYKVLSVFFKTEILALTLSSGNKPICSKKCLQVSFYSML